MKRRIFLSLPALVALPNLGESNDLLASIEQAREMMDAAPVPDYVWWPYDGVPPGEPYGRSFVSSPEVRLAQAEINRLCRRLLDDADSH